MRIICLSDTWTVVMCFLVWPLLQVGSVIVCLNLPDSFFAPDIFLFRSHSFEKDGLIYNRIFRVRRWKHLLPDGGMVWKKRGFKKKKLDNFSEETLKKFLVESARGEMAHWLAILPFWVFWFFTPPLVPWVMLVYALSVNIPCIIVQRYNRPRVERLLKSKIKRQDRVSSYAQKTRCI